MRDAIEQVFPVKVFDRYGSRDAGLIGYECQKHTGLHVNQQTIYLESIYSGEDRQTGLALVTLLENYAMPFIRYQIGDMLVMKDEGCTCGRGAPLIERVLGRTQDFLTLRGGKLFVGEFITHYFGSAAGIKNFQLVQESLDDFVLHIVKGERFEDAILEEARNSIWEKLGRECRIETVFVDQIPPNPAGKFRSVISKVPVHFDL